MIRKILLLFLFGLFSNLIFSQTFMPGITYWDSTGFVEYHAGNLPIILSAPHGGNWSPDSIPDRDCSGCSYLMDSYTRIITYDLVDKIHQITGCYPHMIMNRLHRKKFDANRDIEEAADGNPLVEQAWYGYHNFIDSAKSKVVQEYGRGLFLDIHGHAHVIQRIELGYLLNSQQLAAPEEVINSTLIEFSSIRKLVNENIQTLTHSELLRGESSFGTLLNNKGFPSVPSSSDPFPKTGEPYFTGGYNTDRHGSKNNDGAIDAIQIELNQDVRFNESTRNILTDSLSQIILNYIDLHYLDLFLEEYCNLISHTIPVNSEISNFSLFPNPASEYFSILPYRDNIEIEVYNLLGQKIPLENLPSNQYNIQFLSNGVYLILIKEENKIIGTYKLLKQ